jgi:CRP/FNR family transcriptional regulator, anaerobic regulatory protein
MTFSEVQIKKYLQKFIDVTDVEIQQFLELTETMTVEKGKVILDIDKKCKHQFFIISGLLISFNINERGNDKVIQISTENTWTGDLTSYLFDKPANRVIKSYEKTELLLLKYDNWKKLLESNCKFEKLFRILFQNAYIEQTNRVSSSMKLDMRERLEKFIDENPNLLKRVQKKIIASYLDMTPETLSRLSKKHFA